MRLLLYLFFPFLLVVESNTAATMQFHL
jgi:hypothetical protein